MKKPANLPLRLLTSAFAMAYLLYASHVGGWLLKASIGLITLIGSIELTRALRAGGATLAVWPSVAYAVLMAPVFHFTGSAGLIALLACCACLSLCALVLRGKAEGMDVFATTLAIVYPILPFTACLVFIEKLTPEAVANAAMLAGFLMAFGTDTAAYFVGVWLGKRQLAPHISPNKTVEGAIGGLVGGAASGALLSYLLRSSGLGLMLVEGVFVGLIGAFWSICGDLAASAVKRFCKIKDFGTLFPGHGGLLDRLDGAAFCLVWTLVYFMARSALMA